MTYTVILPNGERREFKNFYEAFDCKYTYQALTLIISKRVQKPL